VTGEPHLAIPGDADGGRAEPTHRDTGLMQGGNSRKKRCTERGCRWWGQRSAGQNRAERYAFVRLDRDPEPVGIGAPREDRREGRMAVLE